MNTNATGASRVFAILPAAGKSRRMGQPKLLLPWRDGTVIDSVLKSWTSSRVSHIVLVCRENDNQLIEACSTWPVHVVSPKVDPPDMKCSIQFGVEWIVATMHPKASDHWMVAPADLPTLQSNVIDRVIAERHATEIVVPRFDGHASHPVLLPWNLTRELAGLGTNEGLKSLIERNPKRFVDLAKSNYAQDIDTPEDYERFKSQE